MNIMSAAVLAEALKTANGETLSEKLSTLNMPNVIALKSNRGYEVLMFTDDESCRKYGGFLADQRIISPSGHKGTIKGAGFYEGDFRHGQCDPSGPTVWIALDINNGAVTCVGDRGGPFDLSKEGYVLESESN